MLSQKMVAALACFVFCTCPVLLAQTQKTNDDGGNWPQWRGANRDGVSSETGLLKKWPKDGPKVVWKIENVGVGYSSIVVSNGRIFTQGDLDGVEHVICLNEKDGQLLWAVQPEPVSQELKDRIAAEMKQLDKNENGIVEESEVLVRLGWDFNKSDKPTEKDIAATAEKRTKHVIGALDKDNDEKLSSAEAVRFNRAFSRIDKSEKDVDANDLAAKRTKAYLRSLDKDGDGTVSRKEASSSALSRSFFRIDVRDQDDPKNKNRKVGDNKLSDEEIQKYLAKFEAGKDGLISADELTEYYTKNLPGRDGILTESEIRGFYGGYRNGMGDGPRGTPTVDGDRLYVEGGKGDITCLKVSNGETIWHKSLTKDFGGRIPGWGYSESPLIENDVVIVTPGGPNGTLVALKKETGSSVWQSKQTTQGAHYASPIVADIGGVKQFVQFARSSCFGVDAKTGKLLWEYKNAANGTANCSTPIVFKNHVFASSAYGTGGGLAKITTAGAEQVAKEVYFDKKMGDHHGGTVLVGEHLYSMGAGRLICMEFMTGKIKWQNRGVGKGSLVVADGNLYMLGEGHTVGLAEATPEVYRELGKFRIESFGRPSWAHPVVAGGRLYIRNQHTLTAYDIKGK